jgi:hypothetical protein
MIGIKNTYTPDFPFSAFCFVRNVSRPKAQEKIHDLYEYFLVPCALFLLVTKFMAMIVFVIYIGG